MYTEHTLSSFDMMIERQKKLVKKMHKRVTKQWQALEKAYIEGDREAARDVIARDHKVNLLDFDINKQALKILLRHQPMAKDLRFVISSFKVATDLERIGDSAKAIANHILTNEEPLRHGNATILSMVQLMLTMQKEAVNAWLNEDEHKALATREKDKQVDELYESLFRELLSWMMEDPRNITSCITSLVMSRYVERSGDHVKNICQATYFVVTGTELERVKEERSERYSLDNLLDAETDHIDAQYQDEDIEADDELDDEHNV